jgi:hypothetical protein
MEPIQVGRLVVIFKDIIESEKTSPAVIEHAIDHHPDPILMSCVQQSLEISNSPQFGVDLVVVADVVTVIGGGQKNGIEIDP